MKYPCLEINLDKLRHNVKAVVDLAAEHKVQIAGVMKGTSGLAKCIKAFEEGGVSMIGSSRLDQLETARQVCPNLPRLLLRVPMISEAEDVISLCQYSLNSEISTIEALSKEARRKELEHKIILMADLGDLREGYWYDEELIDTALTVENDPYLKLAGIGTNLGCYGSIEATEAKLEELVELAEKVEAAIGRKLEIISGGATSSIPRFLCKDLPERINHMRIGEGILLARDLDVFYNHDMSFLNQDVYTLKAEVIEIKTKPTHPVGEIAVNAFGKKPTYEDRGYRKRAILAVGKVDIGDFEDIFPKLDGIEIVGGSSDHTIIDVQDFKEELKVGDILEFSIDYGSLIYLTSSKDIKIKYIEG